MVLHIVTLPPLQFLSICRHYPSVASCLHPGFLAHDFTTNQPSGRFANDPSLKYLALEEHSLSGTHMALPLSCGVLPICDFVFGKQGEVYLKLKQTDCPIPEILHFGFGGFNQSELLARMAGAPFNLIRRVMKLASVNRLSSSVLLLAEGIEAGFSG